MMPRFNTGDILAYELAGLMTKVTIRNVLTIPSSESGFPYEDRPGPKYRYRVHVEEGKSKGQIIEIDPNIEDGPRIMPFSQWTLMRNRAARYAPHLTPHIRGPQQTVDQAMAKYTKAELRGLAARNNIHLRTNQTREEIIEALLAKGVQL